MTDQLSTQWQYDPRIDYSKTKENSFVVNGRQTNCWQITFNDPTFSSAPNQSIIIPANQSLLRNAFFRAQGQLTLTGTVPVGAPNTDLLYPGAFGLRSNALMRCIQSIQVTLGGCSDTVNLISQFIDALDRSRRWFWTDWSYWSGSAILPDCCVSYTDLYNTIRSPLANYLTQGNGDLLQTRTSRINVVSTSPTQGILNYDLVVPVLSSVLSGRLNDRLGLVRAGSFQVQLAFTGQPESMLSIDPAFATISNVSGTISSLVLNYQTIDVSNQNIGLQVYDAFNIAFYNEPIGSVASGALGRYSSIQRSWQVNPMTIICGVRPIYPTTAGSICVKPDFWCPIQTLGVNYINTNSYVNNFDAQIYETSLLNGIGVDYNTFAGGIKSGSTLLPIPCPAVVAGPRAGETDFFLGGSPIALDPVRDLQSGLSYADSHGMPSSALQSGFTFTANVSFINQSYSTENLEFITLVVQPMAFVEISPGMFQKRQYTINPATVTQCTSAISHLAEMNSSMDLLGGYSFAKLGSHLGKAAKFVQQNPAFVSGVANQLAMTGVPGLSHIGKYASQYGPAIQAALSGHGAGDEFEIARLRGEKIAGFEPMQAKAIYDEYRKSLTGGGEISRQQISAEIDKNSRSMKSKLQRQ
jgi:hypothetical protein